MSKVRFTVFFESTINTSFTGFFPGKAREQEVTSLIFPSSSCHGVVLTLSSSPNSLCFHLFWLKKVSLCFFVVSKNYCRFWSCSYLDGNASRHCVCIFIRAFHSTFLHVFKIKCRSVPLFLITIPAVVLFCFVC
jgi:hypothetical protein